VLSAHKRPIDSTHRIASDTSNEAIRLKSDDPEFYNNLAHALYGQQRRDAARRSSEWLWANTRRPRRAHNNLGFAPTTKGQYQNAIAELREATRLKPNLAAGAHHAWKRAVSRQKVWRKSVAVTSLIQGMILVRSTYQEHAKLN
jgi:tetratricopeptide (TPR) repeat protein